MICSLCEKEINKGAKVKGNGFIHYLCLKNNPICPTCWLVHPVGACDME